MYKKMYKEYMMTSKNLVDIRGQAKILMIYTRTEKNSYTREFI